MGLFDKLFGGAKRTAVTVTLAATLLASTTNLLGCIQQSEKMHPELKKSKVVMQVKQGLIKIQEDIEVVNNLLAKFDAGDKSIKILEDAKNRLNYASRFYWQYGSAYAESLYTDGIIDNTVKDPEALKSQVIALGKEIDERFQFAK